MADSENTIEFALERLDGDASDRYQLTLEGKVYADIAPQLRARLQEAYDEGLRKLAVDAERLEQIDSAGLGAFVDLLKRLRPQGGKIVFYGLSENIKRVFEITKLKKVMGVVSTRTQALGEIA